MAEKRIIREHPALFLGELRDDFERVYAIDEITAKYIFVH